VGGLLVCGGSTNGVVAKIGKFITIHQQKCSWDVRVGYMGYAHVSDRAGEFENLRRKKKYFSNFHQVRRGDPSHIFIKFFEDEFVMDSSCVDSAELKSDRWRDDTTGRLRYRLTKCLDDQVQATK
jgi:hypothetical protein